LPVWGTSWNSALAAASRDLGDKHILELRIPFSSLAAKATPETAWGILLCRQIADTTGLRKPGLVTIADLSGGNGFHSPWLFPELRFSEDASIPRRTYQAKLTAVGLKAEDQTLPDRVATVVSFKPAISADGFLHNARIISSAYDTAGEKLAHGKDVVVPSVPGTWQSDKTATLVLDTTRKAFKIKLELTSDETGATQWIEHGRTKQ